MLATALLGKLLQAGGQAVEGMKTTRLALALALAAFDVITRAATAFASVCSSRRSALVPLLHCV